MLRNGRYKFRISLHTQDISRSRYLEHPLYTTLLDLNPEFEPSQYRRGEPLDICFQFPVKDREPIEIHAHSSVLDKSQYFSRRLADIAQENEAKKSPFHGIICTITEFSPAVFRVMLRYLYTGRLEILKQLEYISESGAVKASIRSHHSMGTGSNDRITPGDGRGNKRGRTPSAVYFEDLYRIAERYEVQELKFLSLKAIQCNLNITIAISMLAKLPEDACQQGIQSGGKSFGGETEQDRFFRHTQMEIARDIIKEYVQFFSTEVIVSNATQRPAHQFSVHGRKAMITEVGDCVLSNMARLWK